MKFTKFGPESALLKGRRNFWISENESSATITYRERNYDEDHQIIIQKDSDGYYFYENCRTSNLYALIVSSSLSATLFSSYPHTYVALTDETINMPLDQQPWFVGIVRQHEQKIFASGTILTKIILYITILYSNFMFAFGIRIFSVFFFYCD